MKGFQFAGVMCETPTTATSSTIATLRITMQLLTFADSRIPITSTVDIRATMHTAGRLMLAPVKLNPACAHPGVAIDPTCAAVHHSVGDAERAGGRCTPNSASSDTKWADHPTPTPAAPAAYSSTRSHPTIQATTSPIVA